MADPTNDKTDRRRLQAIQQTDLTESRLNQEFVEWLKTKGMNWLLVILLGLCAWMGWNWWRDRQAKARDAAWASLSSATLPAALEEVAATHQGVDAVDALALLGAADRYLASVQSGVRFDRDSGAEDAAVTPELRTEWLTTANTLYDKALARAGAVNGTISPNSPALVVAISALFGKAAVAESQGDVAGAKQALDNVIAAAKEKYPPLAKVAEARRDSLSQLASITSLPSRADLPSKGATTPLEAPVVNDQFIRDLLLPAGAVSTSGTAPKSPTTPQRPQTPPPTGGAADGGR